ncbi:aldehyde dehydrogenase family protein [Prauserella flavalba]|uniref:aldehyde dehydrogenase family protein n=1 Tax=Prauserella flavalba TaxID=1477506 RepID=UPI0036F04997
MATAVNYSSQNLESSLDEAFERALARARQGMSEALPHVVAGKPVADGEVFDRFDPVMPGESVSRALAAPAGVVTDAVAAAKETTRIWRNRPYQDRIALLRAAKAEFSGRAAEIAGVISAETGKTRLEAVAEAYEAGDLIEQYCAELERHDGFVTPMRSQAEERNTDVLRPYGVFGVIAPFNFPVALSVNMTAAALVTGNTVVLKPSDKTPWSTALAAEILGGHLPDGVLNVVHGGAATGQALAEADVDGIAFTGSAEVGWSLVRKLGDGPWARPVLAEMGGQNPAIVTASADLDAAAEGIVRSAFGLSGQKCSACRRVVVDGAVHDQLVDKLVERAKRLSVGDPADPTTDLGPVIDDAIAARLDQALATAGRDGTVVTGGRIEGQRGNFFAPAIVTGLPAAHPLTRDELFAPFLTVTRVDGFAAAIAEANAVNYGLSAGIFTTDDTERERFLDEIEAGVVYVNRREGATTGAWPGIQSFCGWKASGSSGKGGLGPWYLPGFCREQSRTIGHP